jgi:hypothetical protein
VTHAELLAKINKQAFITARLFGWVVNRKELNALRAVVELHKPNQIDNTIWCSECSKRFENSGYYETYPCPTIQAIEKALV